MKRAGISLALVVMLLLGAAAPVQAQAEETGLAAEAESFYRSVLAAKDRETLQTYLDSAASDVCKRQAQPGTMPRAATPCAWKPAAKRAGQTR